ncbi:MAG: hypothetical protein IPL03_12450 [Sterolibacteriaceae bacterium]|nr:hypothetical protein [Candidatus Methylophosphatis haderslevensis]
MPTDSCLTKSCSSRLADDGPFNDAAPLYRGVAQPALSESTIRALSGCLAHFSHWSTEEIEMPSVDDLVIKRFAPPPGLQLPDAGIRLSPAGAAPGRLACCQARSFGITRRRIP